MTQRITAQKLECDDVRKIVARGEIEMIKKEDRPLVLTVVRSSVGRWKRGEGGNVRFTVWLFTIVGTISDLTDNRFRTEKLAAPSR